MSPESEKPSLFRPRFLTLIVLLLVATPVVVANLGHEQGPPQVWPPANPSYGWPLIWYWCEFKVPTSGAYTNLNPELARWSAPRLAANVAIWFVMLAVPAIACQWLLRRYGPRGRYRLRLVTVIMLMLVAAPIGLANLSHDDVTWALPRPSYGWPLIWRWRNVQFGYGSITELDQNYSASRLAGNLAMWLVMLAAPGAACEWLLRRYRPRLRWSLRTMLAAVGLAAVLCAWCVALRDRANLQDPIISSHPRNVDLYFDRWGPKWLDLIGADRYRRRIVGADLSLYSDDEDEQFLVSLRRLPGLQYFSISVHRPTPGMAAALGDLSQLGTLRVEIASYVRDDALWQQCLAAIGRLAQLEELHLGEAVESDSLTHLAGLTNLKSLSLQFADSDDEEDESDEDESDDGPAADRPETKLAMRRLAHLPALPRLEAVDLRPGWESWESWPVNSVVGDQDLHHLAVFPRLKSLNLSEANLTDVGVVELASLKSLEELAIGGDLASAAGLRSLLALKSLKALHVQRYTAVTEAILAELPNQDSLQEREMAKEAMSEEEPTAGEAAMPKEMATSDDGPTPEQEPISEAGWELLHALECLKALSIAQHGPCDKSDRLTTLALDHGDRIFALQSEVDGLERAFDELRQANPGIVIDSDAKWFDPNRGKKSPYPQGAGMF